MTAHARRLVLALVVGCLVFGAAAPAFATGGPGVPVPTDARIVAAGGRLVAVTRVGGRTEFRVTVAPRGGERTTALRMAAQPGLVALVPDVPVWVDGWPADGSPSDPRYGSQPDFAQIQVPAAWRTTRGAGAVVAVLDTGAELSHPDFAGLNVLGTYNAIDGTSNVADGHGHGTHVLGTVAAATDNGIGVAGVAPAAGVLVVKVLDDTGSGYFSWICDGIEWAIAHGATVITMSIGSNAAVGSLDAYRYATDDAYAAGVTVTAAAGNAGTSAVSYPASYPHVISVASVSASNAKSTFSQYNDYVDVAAPGEGIMSTYRSASYGYMTGTSMATPHVAGVIALLQSTVSGMSPDAVANALAASATDLGPAGRDDAFGYGVVNAGAALQAAASPTPTPTPTPAPDLVPPALLSLTPVGVQASLAGAVISTRWSEPLEGSGAQARYTVTSAAPGLATRTIAGSTTYDALTRTLSFTPSAPLPAGPGYTVRVENVRDLAGNLAPTATWTFSGQPDIVRPVVTGYGPSGAGLNLAAITRLYATYGEPLGDDGRTATITVVGQRPGLPDLPIAGRVTYDAVAHTLLFTPSAAIPYGPRYTVTVSGARDQAGNLAATTTWAFRGPVDTRPPTVIATSPSGKGVPVGTAVRVTFDESLAQPLTTATLTVRSGRRGTVPISPVAGTLSWSAATRTLTFRPATGGIPGLSYRATLSGARDVSGNLAPPTSWVWNGPPADRTAPVIVSKSQVVAANLLRPTITGRFSEPVEGATVVVTAVSPAGQRTNLAGTIRLGTDRRTFSFVSSVSVRAGSAVRVTVSGARDPSRNVMLPYAWWFRV